MAVGQTVLDNLPPEVWDQVGGLVVKLVLKEHKVSGNAADQQLVEQICRGIAAAAATGPNGAGARAFRCNTQVVEGPDIVNAIALPGGRIIVYEGLLRFIEDHFTERQKDVLAFVIGHEMVHVLAQHFAKLMSQEVRHAIALAYTGKRLSDGGLDPAVASSIMAAFGLADGLAVPHFMREQESEADHSGLLMMARAGYDPEAAVPLWQERSKLPKKRSLPSFFDVHPSDPDRIKHLEGWMPEALAARRKADGQTASLPAPGNQTPQAKR
jgi:predicted Zn-dependent protease